VPFETQITGGCHPERSEELALSLAKGSRLEPLTEYSDQARFFVAAAPQNDSPSRSGDESKLGHYRSSPRGESGCRRPSALLVCALVFVIYNSNLRVIQTGDSAPASLIPFSLLIDHSFNLDRWIGPYLPPPERLDKANYVTRSRGHWMSVYPIELPVLITPLYIPAAWWMSHLRPAIQPGDVVFTAVVNMMEKLSASLIAVLSAAFLYLALGRILSPRGSVAVTLIYALASNTWTISSQALWRHGLTELSFAVLLWTIIPLQGKLSSVGADRELPKPPFMSGGPQTAFFAGLALAAAAANKPVDAVFAIAFVPYFLSRRPRSSVVWFLAPLAIFGSLVLTYNQHFFGRWMGGYPALVPWVESGGPGLFYQPSIWEGVAGLLVSPNRGLFIYMPWTIFALWGAVLVWKENFLGWGRWLILAMLAVFVVQVKLGQWWGGWCFGPRYLTDFLPLLALLLARVWPAAVQSRLLRSCLGMAIAIALAVQMIGVYYYPGGMWYYKPVSVESDPSRLWDWRDTELRRSWKAGPAKPELFYSAYMVFGNREVW
jgi:hypothetical protein